MDFVGYRGAAQESTFGCEAKARSVKRAGAFFQHEGNSAGIPWYGIRAEGRGSLEGSIRVGGSDTEVTGAHVTRTRRALFQTRILRKEPFQRRAHGNEKTSLALAGR